MSSDRLASITNYAQKTEADTYNSATSYEDYFQHLAERIYRIQKDYEEKQIAKRQQTLTTTLTSIDKSAGDQGPPNRIAPTSDYSTSVLTTQIKSESDNIYQSNSTTTTLSGSSDKHRITTDGITRLAIHTNNSNVETNGNCMDTTHIKTEKISSNHDSKIQVRVLLSQTNS